MKELIAVIAVIVLGIAVGGVIVGFQDTAEDLDTDVTLDLTTTVDGWTPVNP